MKLLKHSSGMIVSIGFDPVGRTENPHMIRWSDIDGKEWDCRPDNTAGWVRLPQPIYPQFVAEADRRILLFQPELLLVMRLLASPLTWGFQFYRPEEWTDGAPADA